MTDYKRFTVKNWREDRLIKAYERLAEFEDKIEDGTLIELPCKVGDKAYCIYHNSEYEYWIEEEEVVNFIVATDGDIDIGTACRIIGKVYRVGVFLTRAEAEQCLKAIKKEQDND